MKAVLIHKKVTKEIEQLDFGLKRQLTELIALLAEGESLGMPVSRPMPTIAHGVHELRIKDRSGQYNGKRTIEGAFMKSYFEAKNLEDLCILMGLPETEAPKLKVRLSLAKAIKRVIEKKKMTHVQASKNSHVGRTVITAIMNGNLDKISTDRLLDIAQALGVIYQLKVA